MRVKAGPDAAVTRLHASTRRPDIGGTVPYNSSLLRHCACCRKQHNGGNYKNILPHSLSSSFCTPDMHGLTPGNQVGFCPTTVPITLCQWSRCQWRRCQWSLCRLRVACHAVRDVLRGVYHAVRGVLCAALRRSIPLVWASTSDTVSTVAGTARANAAVTPRREKAVRREISSDLSFSVMCSNLPYRYFCLCLRDWRFANVRRATPPSRVKRAFPARPIRSLPRERGRVSASCRSIHHPVRGWLIV